MNSARLGATKLGAITDASGELLFCRLRSLHFCRSDILDLRRRGAVDVPVVAIEINRALHIDLVFREGAILKPEFHGTFRVLRFRSVGAAATAKREQFFGSRLREFCGV